MIETDAIRLQTFCSVYERSDDPEWQERAKAVRRLLARVRELEALLETCKREGTASLKVAFATIRDLEAKLALVPVNEETAE